MQMTAWLSWIGQRVPGAVVTGLCILAATIILSATAIRSDSEKDVAVGNSVNLSSKLTELCAADDETSRVLHSARTPDGKGLCDTANEVLTNPTTQAVALMTDSRVTALIRSELAKQPAPRGVAPSLSQVTDAVRNVMVTNPVLFKGEKGDAAKPPSSAEISSLVSAYIRANPVQFQGKPGENGKPGKDACPSQQQQIQVSGYVMLACVVGRAPVSEPPTATTTATQTVTRTEEPEPTREPEPTTDPPRSTESDTPTSTQEPLPFLPPT